MAADRAAEIMDLRRRSYDWMAQNFWQQWIDVFKAYKCERTPEKDPNKPGEIDPTQTAVGMPDTWALVRRQVARITAQAPNLRFRADDAAAADKISRKLMWDWDRAKIQRQQKRHVTQACLFGWSVRAWSWEAIEYPRNRRVNPLDCDQETRGLVRQQYGQQLGEISAQYGCDPDSQEAMALLVGQAGRGEPPYALLPISYQYRKYEGPRADFLFVGDCFPEPNYRSLNESHWFIVRRRRNWQWMKRAAERYRDQLAAGIKELIERYPDGTQDSTIGQGSYTDQQNLRRQMLAAIDRIDATGTDIQAASKTMAWTVYECHYPGPNARVCFVGEENIWMGEISPYPYDLDGKIAFTELVLIDDILNGIGDSYARIVRGLQQMHDRGVNRRDDLVDALVRPLVWTSDRSLYENPDLVKRGPGFRLVFLRGGPSDLGIIGEQSAMASVAVGLQQEESIQRLFQLATGESNMSMAANVDPQQTRTATGARLLAFNMDILSKDLNDAFTATSLNADAEMMYLLNRSEMPAAVSFDAAPFIRSYDQPVPQQDPMTVTPLDFQIDGEVEAEAGSTLADDDDAKLGKAQNLFAAAVANPTTLNVQKATQDYLIAMGKGRELQAWAPPPPPPPPPAEPLRESITVSVKLETLDPLTQQAILQKAGLAAQPPQPPQMPGPPGIGASVPAPPMGTPANMPPPPSGPAGVPIGPATRAAIGTRAAVGSPQ